MNCWNLLSHETMEADSIIRFKKAIEKFMDNGDIRDVPASITNLTNMGGGGVREESTKNVSGLSCSS